VQTAAVRLFCRVMKYSSRPGVRHKREARPKKRKFSFETL
jgi:hypothetical protein